MKHRFLDFLKVVLHFIVSYKHYFQMKLLWNYKMETMTFCFINNKCLFLYHSRFFRILVFTICRRLFGWLCQINIIHYKKRILRTQFSISLKGKVWFYLINYLNSQHIPYTPLKNYVSLMSLTLSIPIFNKIFHRTYTFLEVGGSVLAPPNHTFP